MSIKFNSSVYILIDNLNQRLKIGKANDISSRFKAFSYVDLKHSEAIEIVCRDEQAAKKIEKMLHAKFDDFKIASNEIGDVDGKDEWFLATIKEKILSFVESDDRLISIKKGIDPFELKEAKKFVLPRQEKDGIQRQTVVYDVPKEWIFAIKNKAYANMSSYMKAALREKLQRDGHI